jgi:hypothetical protein
MQMLRHHQPTMTVAESAGHYVISQSSYGKLLMPQCSGPETVEDDSIAPQLHSLEFVLEQRRK